MRNLETSERFIYELNLILDFMVDKGDSQNAIKFHDEIYARIANIPFMPFRFRKNDEANNENIRELIYKGYKVPFHITTDKIEVLGIYKTNLWSNKNQN